MTQIQLQYGQSSLSLTLPGDQYKILSGNEQSSVPLTDERIGVAFDAPIESEPLEELFAPGDSILLVVSDATRATACDQIVNLFVRRLIELGISPRDIAIIFATGIHRRVTSAEKVQLLTSFIVQRIRTLDHDANNQSSMISLGTTARGTPVEVNRALKEFSHVVTVSGVAFHYFAGFTGGRKSICPGLASTRTIDATHMLALDFETGGRRSGVDTAKLAGNAVNEECERVAALVGPRLGINTIVDERGRAAKVFCGEPYASHRTACAEYLDGHSMEIDARRDLVLVSCGGSPYDINLIQAHKALEMAAHACSDGGTIVLLAECVDGFGRTDFLKWFDETNSRALAYRLRTRYEVNGQTAWALWSKAERFNVYLFSGLADDNVRRMRLNPLHSTTEIEQVIASHPSGYVMPHGARYLPIEK